MSTYLTDITVTEKDQEQIQGYISDLIHNDTTIGDYCNKLALEHSGTVNWTEEDWENEEDPRYELYYSWYSAIQTQLVIGTMNSSMTAVSKNKS